MKKPKIIPPVIALGLLILSFTLHFVLRPAVWIGKPISFEGYGMIVAGIALMVWAQRLFKKKGTVIRPTQDPTALVVEGPFRFTRNPMYLGIVIVFLGIAIAVGTWPMFISPVVFALMMRAVFIPFEENNLERIFGEDYRTYKRQVQRWL